MSTTDVRRMTKLWERMTALYGGRWELEYGPCTNGDRQLAPLAIIWAEALADLPNDAIAKGLRACLDSGDAKTPSLPAFLRMCGRVPTSSRIDPSHQLVRPSWDISYKDTQGARCECLAESYQEMADRELKPRLIGLLPEQRKAAVRAYWLSVLASIAPMGAVLAKRYQETSP
jgi:hypothetical protein